MNAQKTMAAMAVACLLTACATTQGTVNRSTNIPDWVLNPVVEDGIAAADCIKFSGNFSVDQKMAAASARLALAQQIGTNIEGLDKAYLRRAAANEDTSVGTNFSSVSKQLAMSGSRVVKTEIVNMLGKEHYCALMTLSPAATRGLFDAIIKESGRRVNTQDEKFLYEEFKAFKAEQDLDKEIQRLTD